MQLNNDGIKTLPDGPVAFRFNGVPVVVQPLFWPIPFLVIGVLTWIAGLRRPDRSWSQRLAVGLLAAPVAMFADIGHAMAHTISARLAGAPMDEILLSAEMPRTLYENNRVSPQVHMMRSLGGPLFSLICSALSLLWRFLSPHGSLSRELSEISLVGHSFILSGSVVPMPMVDGGIMLKWQLVRSGKSVEQADRMVHQASSRLGALVLLLGCALGLMNKRRWVGGLLAACGLAGIAAGKGWLK